MTTEHNKLEEARKIALDVYRETGDLKQASLKSGLNALSLFKYLTIKGALTMKDRCNLGNASTRLGAQAELEFKKLCPIAMLVNSDEKQHKAYDFILPNGQTIDVKAASLIDTVIQGRGTKTRIRKKWKWTLQRNYQDAKGADYYVLIALNGDKLSHGYSVYVLPTLITFDVKKVEVTADTIHTHWLREYRVERDEVLDFFDEISKIPTPEQTQAYKEIFLDDGKDHFDSEIASIKQTNIKIKRVKNERKKHQHVA